MILTFVSLASLSPRLTFPTIYFALLLRCLTGIEHAQDQIID